jgi:selenocysteine-specific elongation factor
MVSPPGLTARVRGLHVQDQQADTGRAGDRCAVALKGDFDKQDIERGMWLIDPSLHLPLTRFQGELRVPPGQQPVKHMQAVHVHLGTDNLVGRVALLDCKRIEPGGTALAEILLERETLALRGDRFILRDAGARRTVGGGRVLDIFPPTRHKRTEKRLALLDQMRHDDPAATLQALAEQAAAGVDLQRFALAWNLSDEEAKALWERSGIKVIRDRDSTTGFTHPAWDALKTRLLDTLAGEHENSPDMIGVEPDRLRRMTLAQLARGPFDALCQELHASGQILLTRAWLHLSTHQANVTEADQEKFTQLKPLLDEQAYNPPRVRDVANATGVPEHEVRQLFKRLARAGELYPVAHDHYFTAAAVARLAAIVRELNEGHGGARAATFRDILYPGGGGGRKVAIGILEFFDRVGYTRRVRDDHVLREDSAAPPWSA